MRGAGRFLSQRAFTLVELIVTLAVAGLLAALLLPLVVVRQRIGGNVSCMSHHCCPR